jgi:signal transduction histidine kinase/CheY-like chemotaxis protein
MHQRKKIQKKAGKFTQFKTILDTISDQIIVFDPRGRAVYVNNAVKEAGFYRNPRESPLPERYQQVEFRDEDGKVIPPESYPSAKAFRGVATKNNIFEYCDKGNNTRRWYHTNATPIFNENGKVIYAVISYRDITSRKRSEIKLRFLVNAFKILSRTLDQETLLSETVNLMVPVLADWAAIDIFGYGPPKRIAIAHHDQRMLQFLRDMEQRYPMSSTTPEAIFQIVKNGEGSFYPELENVPIPESVPAHEREVLQKLSLTSAIAVPIISRGKVIGALSLAYAESRQRYDRDDLEFVTEFCNHIGVLMENARLYKEIEGQNVSKERFLATLSHELRNPLSPIKTSLEVLRLKNIADEDLQRELKVMERQFDHMTKLLGDLLELSRFTHGRITIKKSRVELVRLIKEIMEAIMPQISSANLVFCYAFPEGPVEVLGDPVRLTQAITNVLHNAIKFTPQGGTIWLTVTREDYAVCVSIKDTGIGIPAEMIPHLFKLDTKGNRRGSNELNDGLGIGLMLVKHILDLHGAKIHAASAGAGFGSEFAITIPLPLTLGKNTPRRSAEWMESGEPAVAEKDASPQRKEDVSAKKKVLVVDDNRDAADALARLLTVLGFFARAAYSAESAIALGKQGDFDAIILDIGMPQMDGYEIAKKLRADGFSKMLVALTGYGQAEDKLKARNAGFDHHITKPPHTEELRTILNATARTR